MDFSRSSFNFELKWLSSPFVLLIKGHQPDARAQQTNMHKNLYHLTTTQLTMAAL